MLCVTGREVSTRGLLERLEAVEQRLAGTDYLQEVRLDYLEDPDEGAARLGPWASRLIVTCRPSRQGGGYDGQEDARVRVLERAAATSPRYVDLEADAPVDAAGAIRRAGARGIMASWHLWDFGGPEVASAVRRLLACDADRRKLAVAVSDAADLVDLRGHSNAHGDLFTIGMGPAGALSRCRYREFGAQWTYVSAEAETTTAPGQMTLETALAWGLPDAAGHPFVALLGGPQIAASPGPACYNRLFRHLGRPWTYVPVVTTRGSDALRLTEELGAMGAAVTMPNKAEALAFAEPDPLAEAVGAANTVRFGPRAVCTNTDVVGVTAPLERALEGRGEIGTSALVLGAGGAARAAAHGCRQLGLEVQVSSRRAEAAAQLVGDEGRVPWDRRHESPARILINATPVGGKESPWPRGVPLRKDIVFDLTLQGTPSALLTQAREEGAQALDGLEMWLEQGAAQTRFLTGLTVSVEDLRGALQ
ncbi:MAG: type I 3-dehydroquinate dehydratase [Gemmatimonadetes bacterium]|nr:type I 3-dehydroquinate dehydratase [Gemmatimonadota bacterium]